MAIANLRCFLVLLGLLVAFPIAAVAEEGAVPKEWQSLDVAGLTALANELQAKGDTTKAERERLASYVAQRYTADAATGRGNLEQWLDLQAILGPEFPAEIRAAMAESLSKNLVPRIPAELVALPPDRVARIGAALAALGQRPVAGTLCVTWVNGSEKYKGSSVVVLLKIAFLADTQDKEAVAARQRLAAHVLEKFLVDPETVRTLNCSQWKGFSRCLGKEVADENARAMWRKMLYEAFAEPKVLPSLNGEDVQDLVIALGTLGDKESHRVVPAWMATGTTAWQSLPPSWLVYLGQQLDLCKESGLLQKARMAEFILTRYLATTKAVREVAPWTWWALAGCFAKDVKEESRRMWAERLRVAFFGDAESLGKLNPNGVLRLVTALERLGDKDTLKVLVAWASRDAAWQSLQPEHLESFAKGLAKGGDETKALRLRLVEHVTKVTLASSEATRGVGCGGWHGMSDVLVRDLSPEVRKEWRGKLRAAYTEPQALASMMTKDLYHLGVALGVQGDKSTYDVWAAWMSANAGWKRCGPGDLTDLAQNLAKCGDSAKGLRKALAEHVTKTYVASPGAVQKVPCGNWRGLAGALGNELDDATRRAWVDGIVSAHVGSPEALKTLKTGDTCDLLAALAALGETAGALSVVERALAARPWTGSDLTQLAGTLSKLGEGAKAGRQRLLEHVSSQCRANGTAAKSLSCSDWAQLVRNLGGDLTKEQRAVWRDGLRASFVADAQTLRSLNRADVTSLADALQQLGDQQSSTVVAAWILRR